MQDSNKIIRAYLVNEVTLTALVSTRIYVPRLPENAVLPAVGFFTRGGGTNPHIPPLVSPSVQFDCWADSLIGARAVYMALFEVLQGIQNETVTVGGTDYRILSAIEEVQGQDLSDIDFQNIYRVLTFFSIMVTV